MKKELLVKGCLLIRKSDNVEFIVSKIDKYANYMIVRIEKTEGETSYVDKVKTYTQIRKEFRLKTSEK